jgi:hypothetical protein
VPATDTDTDTGIVAYFVNSKLRTPNSEPGTVDGERRTGDRKQELPEFGGGKQKSECRSRNRAGNQHWYQHRCLLPTAYCLLTTDC